jgi:hypothetical protein
VKLPKSLDGGDSMNAKQRRIKKRSFSRRLAIFCELVIKHRAKALTGKMENWPPGFKITPVPEGVLDWHVDKLTNEQDSSFTIRLKAPMKTSVALVPCPKVLGRYIVPTGEM